MRKKKKESEQSPAKRLLKVHVILLAAISGHSRIANQRYFYKRYTFQLTHVFWSTALSCAGVFIQFKTEYFNV